MYHFSLDTVDINLQPVTDSVGRTGCLLAVLGLSEALSVGEANTVIGVSCSWRSAVTSRQLPC